MLKEFFISLRIFILMLIITGVFYTLAVHYTAQKLFPKEANGSLILKGSKIIGSKLIAQKFSSDKYFWSRPSAVDYNGLGSGGSNLSATSKPLQEAIKDRKENLEKSGVDTETGVQRYAPQDLLSSSASGLDPHISPNSAIYQLNRVIESRKLNIEEKAKVLKLIKLYTEDRDLGILGEQRVNVLLLNKALDEFFR